MTPEIAKLSGRELDAEVMRKVMGKEYVYPDANTNVISWEDTETGLIHPVPKFHKDYNAVRQVIEEIQRRGLHIKFIGILEELTDPDDKLWMFEQKWELLKAPAPTLCRAAIMAAEGAK